MIGSVVSWFHFVPLPVIAEVLKLKLLITKQNKSVLSWGRVVKNFGSSFDM